MGFLARRRRAQFQQQLAGGVEMLDCVVESLLKDSLAQELETINADGTANLPLPTVVLLDAEHRVAWVDIRPNYTARTEVADILDAVDTRIQCV